MSMIDIMYWAEQIEENAAVIGLSALMTTTMLRMKDVIELCKEKGCSSKVIIGGACITQSYADEIGADGYSKDAAECVKLVEKLLQKQKMLCPHSRRCLVTKEYGQKKK